jgi:hypothetical protein
MRPAIALISLLLFLQFANAQTSYTWNGSLTSSWNAAGNWTPNGIPASLDNVTIVTGSHTCQLNTTTTISNFTLTSGTLDMGGDTLTTGTAATFSSGTVQNGTFLMPAATTVTFGNSAVTMNCIVTITSAAITLKNTTFQKALTITKTGSSNDASSGGNIFNGTLTATNTGSGYLMFGNGNGDQFNAAATFNNTGTSSIYAAYNSAGNTFNNNIVVSSSNGGGILFCNGSNTAAATLSSGYTITIGSGGFSAGTLGLRQFNQSGATVQSLSLSGTAGLTIGPSSVFGGNFTASSPALLLNGGTFNGTTNLTKTGSSGDFGVGGNTYNGACDITNSGSSYLVMGNTNPDIWNSTVTFTDNGSERLLPAWASAGNQFNGNIYVNTSGSAVGVQFCGGNTTATATLAAGMTIAPGTGGLTAGYLYLRQFTEAGSAAINLSGTGTSAIYLGPTSSFGGTMTVTAPDIIAQGATYSNAATFTKTGGGNDNNNNYQNIFSSTCTINQQSSTGAFTLGQNSNDQFNGNIIVTSTGTGGIYLGANGGSGTPTMAAGNTISAGSAGFSAGFLWLSNFTQLGNTPINLTFTGSSTYLVFSHNAVIGGNLTTSTPDIYFNGATFNGTVNATKTGANNDYSSGGNTFQTSAAFTDAGAGLVALGNGTADTYNGAAIFNNTGSSYIGPAWNSTGNAFNGNIVVSSTGSSQGVYFCNGSGSSTATLASGDTLQIGPAGFSSGTLQLRQFTQQGSATTNLSLTGTTTLLQVGPSSTFGGDFTVVSPRILLNGGTFSDTTSLTKTGSTGEWSNGGNTFNSTLIVNMQGSAYFGFANNSPDIYNGDVHTNNNSTDRIIFGGTSTGNQFNGNIIVTQTGTSVGTAFGWANGCTMTQAAGKTISIGAAGYNTGYLQIERFTQQGSAPVNLTLTGTASLIFGPTTTINGNLTSGSPALFFNGCTFNGTVNSTKTGATNDYASGGNIFNNTTTITGAGSGFIALANGNPDQFNGVATFNNTGSANMYVANNSTNNVFGGLTTFNNNPTANTLIYVSQGSTGTVFNGNIVVSSSNGQGVQFCTGNTTATASLSAGYGISIGSGGFSAGTLNLRQFTQLGSAPTNLTLTGATTLLQTGPLSAFGGDFTVVSPRILLQTSVFSDTTILTKTGATGEWSYGGNTFNNTLTVNQQGSGYFGFANGAPDTYNGDVYANNNSTERIIFGDNPTGNQFNGNIILTQIGSSVGIAFGWSNTTSETQAAGKTISIGAAGFSTGYLQIEQFTQLGSTPMNLPLTGTSSLTFGPTSAIGGNLTSTSGSLYFNGCTFSGTVNSTKTGATNDYGNGNNIFNGVTVITNSGSGYIVFGNGNSDQFNSQSTFNNTGSASMYVAFNSPNNVFGGLTTFNNAPTANTGIYVSPNSTGTTFNSNIVVNSSNGQGVQFCTGNTSATATLSAGNTITVGAGGFTAGTLLLRQFIQSGSTPQNLTLTGAGNLTFGPSSTFGGNTTTVSPTLFFNGCSFAGTVTATKNGTSSDASNGNNTFNGAFTVTNTGAGFFLMGNGNPDLWQSTAVFNNQSTGQHMYIAYNSTGNTFNGDVTFNNQPGSTGLWIYPNYYGINTQFNGNIVVTNVNGGGVYFGVSSGTATLAGSGSVSVGAAGFNSGGLIFKNFIQTNASAAQNITTTGTSYIQYGSPASFAASVTSSSPGLLFNGSTFNGIVNCTKTGTSNDQSQGGNTFNAAATFTNNGTGYLLMTINSSDAYNSNTSFVMNGTGIVYPNFNNSSNYAGNLSVTSTSAITFGSGTGTATFSGAANQNINATTGTPTPVFTRLVINNTGSGVTLNNTSINVSNSLSLASGLLNTSTTYILTMLNGSTTAAGTALSASYVNGPMAYQKSTSGVSTLNFPIGTAPDCRPFILTVNHSTGTLYTYTAQLYDASAGALGWTLPPSVTRVSAEHYYTIARTNAAGTSQPVTGLSGNQTIQIFFGTDDYVTDGSTLTIVKNTYSAPTAWIDIGGNGGPAASGGANLTGSIISTSGPTAFNSFSTFAIANKIGGANVLPIKLLYFNARPDNSQVDLGWGTATESNNNYFTIERSHDGVNFDSLMRVNSLAFDGNSSTQLDYTAVDPSPLQGTSFYRLKQTDLDGNAQYSNVESVYFGQHTAVSAYPNPSAGTLYVSGLPTDQSTLKAEWYDIGGRLLLQQMVAVQGGIAMLTTHFANGVYVLKFQSADGTVIAKNVLIMK